MRQLKPSLRRTLHQNVLEFKNSKDEPPSVAVIIYSEDQPDEIDLSVFSRNSPLGVAPGYGKDGTLIALGICDGKNGILIEFKPERVMTKARESVQGLLCNNPSGVYSFDCGTLAMSLYKDLGIRLKDGIDIQSAFPQIEQFGRKPVDAVKEAIGKGEAAKIVENNLAHIFHNPTYDLEDRQRHLNWSQHAWIAQFVVNFYNNRRAFDKVRKINTADLNFNYLEMLAKISTDGKRLDHLKPTEKIYSYTQKVSGANPNEITVAANNFNNRFRKDAQVQMTVSGKLNNYVVHGIANAFAGPTGAIHSTDEIAEDLVVQMRSLGRDDPTLAELNRDKAILQMLSDPLMFDNVWIRNIWHTHQKVSWKKWPTPIARRNEPHPASPEIHALLERLNPSQQDAVNNMLNPSSKKSLIIIQGPPGTGKTSVISTFVSCAVNLFEQSGIWLVAQSNVAVKNIAEKLVSIGFTNWRLLVSKDFHFGWHEHLYGKVEPYVIRSEEFKTAGTRRKMQGINVMLCTLSMLSNKFINIFTKHVPIETLVVDEASQIEIGSYLSVFTSFKSPLRKVIMIGDDKQLPPYGQEDLQDLQSIFEVPHLQNDVIFLNTQYRMPPQIGSLISASVYDQKLFSNPKHPAAKDPFTCFFVDIPGNEESARESYKNTAECEAIIKLAQKLSNERKSYKIITPYDGQRNLIETTLKENQMQWEDTCFNVDSFQGNEEDYIIISVVRSHSLGFLTNKRRTNVMLSRCKLGMYIVSSRNFLLGIGKKTLVGEFAQEFSSPKHWLTIADLEDNDDFDL